MGLPGQKRDMKMKRTGLVVAGLMTMARLTAVGVGDSYMEVVAEKGQPAGRMEAGGVVVLNYDDVSVKLKAGRVVEVRPVGRAAVTTVTPAAPAPAAPRPVAASQGAPVPLVWTTDLDAALARAKAEQRKVFLFFTGSDWCSWCQRLDGEILSKPEFVQYASTSLVLVVADFPREVAQSKELQAHNRRLVKRFKVDGFPTVVVLDADGKAIGRIGYREGGPKPFIDAISRM